MLAAKPIVGAISGEVKEVIEEADCGYCTESGNYRELAQIITKVYNDKETCSYFGNNSYSYYQNHFEKNKCIDDLVKIFTEEIEKGA